MKGRRLTFNLTALLDVILLMVFAYQIQSLERVSTSEQLKQQADEKAMQLQLQNERLITETRQLNTALEELQSDAQSNRGPSILSKFVEQSTIADQDTLSQAISEVSDKDQKRIQDLMGRLEGADLDDALRELARLESYREHIGSWFLYLEEEPAFGRGVSRIRVVVDEDTPFDRSLGGTLSEQEVRLKELLTEDLTAQLRHSTRLVLIRVYSCNLHRKNRDQFNVMLDRIRRELNNQQQSGGTQFLDGGLEGTCSTG